MPDIGLHRISIRNLYYFETRRARGKIGRMFIAADSCIFTRHEPVLSTGLYLVPKDTVGALLERKEELRGERKTSLSADESRQFASLRPCKCKRLYDKRLTFVARWKGSARNHRWARLSHREAAPPEADVPRRHGLLRKLRTTHARGIPADARKWRKKNFNCYGNNSTRSFRGWNYFLQMSES